MESYGSMANYIIRQVHLYLHMDYYTISTENIQLKAVSLWKWVNILWGQGR